MDESGISFKDKLVRATIVGLVILLVSLAALWFIKTVIPPEEDSYSVIFIIGAHGNSRMVEIDKNTIVTERVERAVNSYGFVAIVVSDGEPALNSRDYDFSSFKPNGYLDKLSGRSKIRDNLNTNRKNILTDMNLVRAITPEVDLIEAINLAARKLHSRSDGEVKEIVILGTGLSTSGALNFTDNNNWLYSDTTDVINILIANKSLPDLEGINVIWCNITDVAEPQEKLDGLRQSNLKEIWSMVMTNSNVAKFEIDETTPRNEIYPASELPEVSLVTILPSPSIISNVIVHPDEVSLLKGSNYNFSAEVFGWNNPSQDVAWSLSGNNNTETHIKDNGQLVIHPDETAQSITVTATSDIDNEVIGKATVIILDPRFHDDNQGDQTSSITEVRINQEDGIVVPIDNTFTYSAIALGSGNPSQEFIWQLLGNTDPNTSIDENGRLYIGANENAFTIIILAISVQDSSKFAERTVVILRTENITPDVVEVNFLGDSAEFINKNKAIQDIAKWVDFINSQESGIYLFGCTARLGLPGSDGGKNLGLLRAEAVKRLFVENYNINPNKIIVKGLGYDNPWHKDNGISGTASWNAAIAAENRRVVIMSADDEFARRIFNDTWRTGSN